MILYEYDDICDTFAQKLNYPAKAIKFNIAIDITNCTDNRVKMNAINIIRAENYNKHIYYPYVNMTEIVNDKKALQDFPVFHFPFNYKSPFTNMIDERLAELSKQTKVPFTVSVVVIAKSRGRLNNRLFGYYKTLKVSDKGIQYDCDFIKEKSECMKELERINTLLTYVGSRTSYKNKHTF